MCSCKTLSHKPPGTESLPWKSTPDLEQEGVALLPPRAEMRVERVELKFPLYRSIFDRNDSYLNIPSYLLHLPLNKLLKRFYSISLPLKIPRLLDSRRKFLHLLDTGSVVYIFLLILFSDSHFLVMLPIFSSPSLSLTRFLPRQSSPIPGLLHFFICFFPQIPPPSPPRSPLAQAGDLKGRIIPGEQILTSLLSNIPVKYFLSFYEIF